MATKIPFNSKNAVLDAYKLQGIDVWSVSQGRSEIIAAGSSEDELEKFLGMLENGLGNAAMYKLNVYYNVDDPKKITNKSDVSRTISFRLDGDFDDCEIPVRAQSVGMVRNNNTADPLFAETQALLMGIAKDAIKEKLSGIGKVPEKEETPSWMDYIKDPRNIGSIVSGIGEIIGLVKGMGAGAVGNIMQPQMQPTFVPATMGNVIRVPEEMPGTLAAPNVTHHAPAAETEEMTAQELQDADRLDAALDSLFESDPDFLVHIEKLATLAKEQPATYKMALNFLK